MDPIIKKKNKPKKIKYNMIWLFALTLSHNGNGANAVVEYIALENVTRWNGNAMERCEKEGIEENGIGREGG